jgi:preprotein translocase subunit SecE
MFGRVKNFFGEVKIETKKVNYPSKEELIGSIWVVLITVLLVAVFLGFIDFGLSEIVNLLVR